MSPSRNCAGDRLTATIKGSGHFAASMQARRNTHSPSGTIRPVSSATEMKCPGAILPCTGCCQRTSASEPHCCSVDQIVLRLVDDLELLAAERQPQLMLDHAPALQRLVHALLEEAHALPAVALGARQSDAGVTEHGRRGVAVGGGERDADAGSHQHLLAGDLKRPAQGLDQPVHERHHVAEIGDIDEGDGELVAGEAGDEIVLAQRRLDAAADVAQHLIAAAMVGDFVDLLELVDVETEHGDMRAVAMHANDGFGRLSTNALRLASPVSASCSSR